MPAIRVVLEERMERQSSCRHLGSVASSRRRLQLIPNFTNGHPYAKLSPNPQPLRISILPCPPQDGLLQSLDISSLVFQLRPSKVEQTSKFFILEDGCVLVYSVLVFAQTSLKVLFPLRCPDMLFCRHFGYDLIQIRFLLINPRQPIFTQSQSEDIAISTLFQLPRLGFALVRITSREPLGTKPFQIFQYANGHLDLVCSCAHPSSESKSHC
ncbi:hypothetical protein MIR68_012156 [Amoeboaphelidium protococcarum]|nr:hypothetical protein MIR68_012156 [Amoeboaphelidium protococcarum]